MWYGKVDGPVEEMRMSLGRKKFIILVGSRERKSLHATWGYRKTPGYLESRRTRRKTKSNAKAFIVASAGKAR